MLADAAPVEDDRIVAKCYVELGNVTKEKGEYDESLRYHRRSMEIFERIDDPLSVADSHLNIAEVYKAKGELKRAMSEYEKGLTLYEDVYVEDSNNSNDVSLNSSSFSDLQHTKALSKSDESLPQTRKENIDEGVPPASPRLVSEVLTNGSTSSMDLPLPSTQKLTKEENTSQMVINTDYSPRIASEQVTSKLQKSLSLTSDRQYINDIDGPPPLLPTNLEYDTSSDSTSEANDFIELCSALVPPFEQTDQELLTTNSLLLETKPNKNNHNHVLSDVYNYATANVKKQIDHILRLWHHVSNRQLLIVVLTLLVSCAVFWFISGSSSNASPLPVSGDSNKQETSQTYDGEDLAKQLRKILAWRKDQVASLNKNSRRMILDFLTRPESRTQITLDKFQQILDVLDIKIVLVPQ